MKNPLFKKQSLIVLVLALVLVALNVLSQFVYFRIDLTGPKSYSLSRLSKETVRHLEEPLSVDVFFSKNLPAPYNTTEQYLRDLLYEYKGAGNRNFSYRFLNMDSAENQETARSAGVFPLQIQEVSNNELGIKSVYMGLAVRYGDDSETIADLTSSASLEYRLTSIMQKLIYTQNTLAGLSGQVEMTLYLSEGLSGLGIRKFAEIEPAVREEFTALEARNSGKIKYTVVSPDKQQVEDAVSRYGLSKITWDTADGSLEEGLMSLVLSYGGRSKVVQIGLARSLLGSYTVSGLEDLGAEIQAALQSVVAKSQTIGYVTGHGERPLTKDYYAAYTGNEDFESAYKLPVLLEDSYTLTEVTLVPPDGWESDAETDEEGADDETGVDEKPSYGIPGDITALIINGATGGFSEAELYELDQFLMRGGNLLVFQDPYTEIQPQGQSNSFLPQMATYEPIATGLETLLESYGVRLGTGYIYDEQCFQSQNSTYGMLSYFWVPIVMDNGVNQRHPVTKNMGNFVFLQTSPVELTGGGREATGTVLVHSSPKAWVQTEGIILNPLFNVVPENAEKGTRNIAVMVEGRFQSAFAAPPAGAAQSASGSHVGKSLQSGKVFVMGSSQITTRSLLDEAGSEPIALFLRNVIDYMNNQEDRCSMRTKGMNVAALSVANPSLALLVQVFNEFGLPLLVVVAFFVMRKIRASRKKVIRLRYNKDDARER